MPKLILKKSTLKLKTNSKSNKTSKYKLTQKQKISKKKSLSNNNKDIKQDTKKDIKKDIKDIIKDKTLLNYIPPVNKHIVYPKNKLWELPNRKHFYNWVNDTFHNMKKQIQINQLKKNYLVLKTKLN